MTSTTSPFRLLALVSLFALLGMTMNARAQGPAWSWAKLMGGPSGGDSWYGIVQDTRHNYFMVGGAVGSIKYDDLQVGSPGPSRIAVAKTGPDGRPMWVTVSEGGFSFGYGVAVDSGGYVYVVGKFKQSIKFGSETLVSSGLEDGFIAKLAPDGSPLWAKRFGGADADVAVKVAAIGDSGCVVVGLFYDTLTFGGLSVAGRRSGQNGFVMRVNSDGSARWARRVSGLGGGITAAVALEGDRIHVAGAYEGQMTLDEFSITSDMENNLFVAGFHLDGAAKYLRQNGGGGTDGSNVVDIDISSDATVTVLGNYRHSFVIGNSRLPDCPYGCGFVVAYDRNGGFLRVRFLEADEGSLYLSDGSVDDYGNCYVTGRFENVATIGSSVVVSHGRTDIVVAMLDQDLKPIWSRSAGSPGFDFGGGIAVDRDGVGLVAVGSMTSGGQPVKFGELTFPSPYEDFMYVARLGANASGLRSHAQSSTSAAPSLKPNVLRTGDRATLVIESPHGGNGRIEIVDAIGRLVRHIPSVDIQLGTTVMPIRVDEVYSGSYFIRVLSDEGIAVVPFIVHR